MPADASPMIAAGSGLLLVAFLAFFLAAGAGDPAYDAEQAEC